MTEFNGVQVPDRLRPKEVFEPFAPPLTRKAKVARCHEVQFYSDDSSFLNRFARFVEAALMAGNAVIVVATDSHRNSLLQRLQTRGVDVFAAIEQGRYIPLDVADTLSTFMVNDMPDPVRFSKAVGDLIARAAKATSGSALQRVGNAHLFCWRKVRRRRRFGSNNSGTKWPERMT